MYGQGASAGAFGPLGQIANVVLKGITGQCVTGISADFVTQDLVKQGHNVTEAFSKMVVTVHVVG